MKKEKFVLGILMLLVTNIYSQIPGIYFGTISTEDKKLVIVIDESEEKNIGIKEAMPKVMEEEWNLTPYTIISLSDFQASYVEYINDTNNLFMIFNYYKVSPLVGSNLGKKLNYRIIIISTKIKKNGNAKLYNTGAYTISLAEDLNMNIKASLTKDVTVLKKFIEGGNGDLKKPKPIIKEKTLYINKNHLGKRGEEDIKNVYPYPFKIVEPEEYAKAILKKPEDIIFFEYIRNKDQTSASMYIFSMTKDSRIMWCRQAKGVNNYVHVNFRVLAEELK